MTQILKNQLNYAVLFTTGVVVIFIFLAENMHQIQHTFRQKQVSLEYKPVGSSIKTAQPAYRLETYQSDSAKFLTEGKSISKSLNKNPKIDSKKNKDLNESQIVDHQIFASPNNIRAKRIFI